jgi:integrase
MVVDANGQISGLIELGRQRGQEMQRPVDSTSSGPRCGPSCFAAGIPFIQVCDLIRARQPNEAAEHRGVVQPGVQEHGLRGCSSHSGRRTFVTRAARIVHKAGGSLRDVQLLAGHRSIQTTQRYIDGDSDAQRKLVSMI